MISAELPPPTARSPQRHLAITGRSKFELAARSAGLPKLRFGVPGSVAVLRLADPVTFCDGHSAFFVAASGPIRMAADRPFSDARTIVEAVIYRLRCGIAWRDLPEVFVADRADLAPPDGDGWHTLAAPRRNGSDSAADQRPRPSKVLPPN